MKLKNIIWSWDFGISLIAMLASFIILPTFLRTDFAASFYSVGISVLSIVFSLFFAALAIIMSSTDNEFILFLEKKKQFTTLLWSFRFTLTLLFVSLIYSIILFTCSDFAIKYYDGKSLQHKGFFVAFVGLFCYSLLATALSVKDTILFSHYRTKFLNEQSRK